MSAAAADRMTVHSRVPAVAARLPKAGRLPPDKRLQLAIGLPLRDREGLTNLIRRLYDPADPAYRQYLTPAQFTGLFGPSEQDYLKVKNYAKAHGLDVVCEYNNRALVDVAGRVDDMEKMFQVQLARYQHPAEDRQFFAPDVEPSVEAGMPISYIVGLDDFSRPRPNLVTNVLGSADYDGSGSNNAYLGSDFGHAYAPGVSLQGEGQIVGLYELQGYVSNDVAKYEALAGYSSVPLQTVVLPGMTNKPNLNNSYNEEIALDIEVVIAMAPKLKEVLIVEGVTGVDAINQLAYPSNGVPLANQVSSSFAESEDTGFDPQLLEMAAQGQSFFMASGDYGAPTNGLCQKGSTYIGWSYPGDYNYATMCGGTELVMSGHGGAYSNEYAWGFSTGYVDPGLPIPDYQSVVNTTENGGSSQYRNVPDVASCADDIEIVCTEVFTNKPTATGLVTFVGGTSAAAPLWAAFTALVNEQAANQGLPPVGFLNPALYSIAQGGAYQSCFHDITNGNNINPWSGGLYNAGPGYDNCTGLGSPNGQTMIDALAGFAGPVWVDFNHACPGLGNYTNAFCSLTSGINAVASGGTVWLAGPNTLVTNTTITKPLTLRAYHGPVTLGQ